jgi:hypothetical protein
MYLYIHTKTYMYAYVYKYKHTMNHHQLSFGFQNKQRLLIIGTRYAVNLTQNHVKNVNTVIYEYS